MVRDPYDWVEAMRVEPHHAHGHVDMPLKYNPSVRWRDVGRPLGWKEFVTKPWIGKIMRGPTDENITQIPGGIESAVCLDRFSFVEIAPCSPGDSSKLDGLANYKYELQHDGSERAYSSVVDLRRDKIINHLSVADFLGTRAFLRFRFEDLNANGTSLLLQSVEEATGLKAKCNATMGKARSLVEKSITKHGQLPAEFIEWMNKFVDWDVERRIGYFKR